jgi:hypothetical protein
MVVRENEHVLGVRSAELAFWRPPLQTTADNAFRTWKVRVLS